MAMRKSIRVYFSGKTSRLGEKYTRIDFLIAPPPHYLMDAKYSCICFTA